MNHHKAERVMDELFVTGSSRSLAKLRQHLRGCPACRRRYDRLVALGSSAAGLDAGENDPPPELAGARLDRLAAELLVARRVHAAPGWRRLRSFFSQQRLALTVVGVTAAAAVMVAVLPQDWAPGDEAAVASRGNGPENEQELAVSMRLFTMAPNGKIRELVTSSETVATISATAPLQIAVTNLADQPRYLTICALDTRGVGGCFLALREKLIPAGAVAAIVPAELTLQSLELKGLVRLFAVFTVEPPANQDLERAVAAHRGRARISLPLQLDGLPAGALQDSALLRVVEQAASGG